MQRTSLIAAVALSLATGVVLADEPQPSTPVAPTTVGKPDETSRIPVGSGKTYATGTAGRQTAGEPLDVTAVIAGWGEKARAAAKAMIDRYGPPHEVTTRRLTWHNNAPWTRTVVHRDEVPHRFPKPHVDVLEQVIDFKVPADRYDELAAFDGSVVASRTLGELSARCDREAMNFLALNLAVEVAQGKKTVAQARKAYAQTAIQAQKAMRGAEKSMPKNTQALLFDVAEDGTAADPDAPIKISP